MSGVPSTGMTAALLLLTHVFKSLLSSRTDPLTRVPSYTHGGAGV